MRFSSRFLAAMLTASAVWLGAPAVADAACTGSGTPNGVWDKTGGEGCDDGNNVDGDGCSSTCTVESGYSCGLAIPFDGLTTWAYSGSANDAAWSSGFTSRTQTYNTAAPTFAHFGIDAQNLGGDSILELYVDQCTYSGNGQNPNPTNCNNGGDDDWVGFVLGFNPATANTAAGKYILIDWKAIAQSHEGYTSAAGLRLSVVEGIPSLGSGDQYGRRSDFWRKTDVKPTSKVRWVANATGTHTNSRQSGQNTYGTTGWRNQTAYQFQFDYTPQRLIVRVRIGNTGTFVEAFNLTAEEAGLAEFPAGEIGFFGLSQPNARYSLIQPVSSICALIQPVDITGPSTTIFPRPPIVGVGAPGATVTITFPGYSGTSVVQPDGTWSHTPTTDLPVGDTLVTANQNHQGVPSTDTHTITRSAHTVAITNPADGAVLGGTKDGYAGFYNVSGTGIPGAQITLTVSGAGATGAGGPFTTTVASNGTWTVTNIPGSGNGAVTLYALSEIAGIANADATSNFTLDNQTAGTITSPANGSTIAGPVTAINGTGEAGATVSVVVNGGTPITATVNANGTWSATVPAGSITNNGSYTVVANFTDTLGNTAGPVNSAFTISSCGVTPAPNCTANSTCVDNTNAGGFACVCNTGYVDVGGTCVQGSITITTPANGTVTSDPTPTINGTTTPNTTVTVSIGGTVIGTTTSGNDGTWTLTPSTPLDDGPHAITGTVTVGGTPYTATTNITVDTQTFVTITGPANNSTSATPITTITGTGEVGATIVVTIDGVVQRDVNGDPITVTVGANGAWSLTLPSPLLHKETPYTIVADATDLYGNTASTTSNASVNIPIAVSVSTPVDKTLTNDATPTVTGTATPGATVNVTFEGENATFPGCTTTAHATTGAWSCTVANANELPDGDYTIVATATSKDDASRTATDDTHDITVDTVTYIAITGPADQTTVTTTVDTITGTGEPGGQVTVTLNGIPQLDTNGDPITVPVDTNGNWSFPLEDPLDSGNHTVTATITDPAGNTMTTSPTEFSVVTAIAVRITEPVGTSGAEPAQTAPVTTIRGTGDADGLVTVTITGTGDTTYTYTSVEIPVAADGTWSLTLPTGSELLHGTYSIRADIVHELDAQITNSHTIPLEVDLDTVIDITELRDGTGVVDTAAQGPLEEVRGTTEPGNDVVVTITNAGGDTIATGAATVAADGTWTYTIPTPISEEDVYTVSATATNGYGHTATDTAQLTIDTSIDVEITSHTDGDETDLPIATVGGTTDPGAEVIVTVVDEDGNSVDYGPVTADQNGNWTLTFPTPLQSGVWELTATSKDDAGNTATDGPITLTVTVNNCTDPVLNTCDANASCTPTGPGTHTCACNEGYEGDGVTCAELPYVEIEGPADGATVRTGTPVIDGNGNPNSPVDIVITDGDGNVIGTGTTTTDGDGNWTWTPEDEDALAEGGPYTVTVTIDLGNGTTPAEDTILITVDLGTDIVIETPAEDDVVSQTPTVTGTAVPNTTVEITVGGVVIGTTTSDANGQWTYTIPEENKLPIGPANIVAKDTGNGSTDEVNVVVERQLIPVEITGPADGETTTDRTPTVTGKGEPNTEVTIVIDGKIVGKVPVDANGDWTWTPDEELELGEHVITARGDDGSEDQITLTIAEEDVVDDYLEVAGGRFFGCNASNAPAPAAVIVLATGALLLLARRREEDAA